MLDLRFINKFSLRYFFLIKLKNLVLNNKFIIIFTSNNNKNNLLDFKYDLMKHSIKSNILTFNVIKKLFFFESFKFLGGLKILVFCNTEEEFFFVIKNSSKLKLLGFSFKFNFSSFIKKEVLDSLYLKYIHCYFNFLLQLQFNLNFVYLKILLYMYVFLSKISKTICMYRLDNQGYLFLRNLFN